MAISMPASGEASLGEKGIWFSCYTFGMGQGCRRSRIPETRSEITTRPRVADCLPDSLDSAFLCGIQGIFYSGWMAGRVVPLR